MKAAISGANGFLGTHLTEALKAKKIKVGKITQELLYSKKNLTYQLEKAQPEYIFILHSFGNMANHKNNDKIFSANLTGVYNILEATKNVNCKAIINISSSSVLLDHQTLYSATKFGAEALCRAYTNEYAKPIVTIRPTSIYGPGEADFRLIPTIFKSCLKQTTMPLSLQPTHDWIYVQDVVEMLIRAAEKIQFVKGTSINCGTGVLSTNKQIADLIVNLTGQPLDVNGEIKRKFDTDRWEVNVSEYNLIFGGAKVKLKEGLEKTYEYYKKRYQK